MNFQIYQACIRHSATQCVLWGLAWLAVSAMVLTAWEARSHMALEAKTRMGGDVEIVTRDSPIASVEANAFMLFNSNAISRLIEKEATAIYGDKEIAIIFRSIDRPYPLYGARDFRQAQSGPLFAKTPGRMLWGAVADPAILKALGANPGDHIMVGNAELRVTASLNSMPDRGAANTLPYLLVNKDAFHSASLPPEGTRYRYRMIISQSPDAWRKKLVNTLPKETFKINDWRDEAPPLYPWLCAAFWMSCAMWLAAGWKFILAARRILCD